MTLFYLNLGQTVQTSSITISTRGKLILPVVGSLVQFQYNIPFLIYMLVCYQQYGSSVSIVRNEKQICCKYKITSLNLL